MRGLFITGTDTNVGKTTVARGLLALARARGLRLVPHKPVETGCRGGRPRDALALWRAAGRQPALALVCPIALAAPLAPLAAAEEQGVALRLALLVRHARRAAAAAPGAPLVVEGAGGLLVPYARTATAADLVARLRLPLLIVARDALGTVNHTALTVAEARRRGLSIAGIVLVRTTARRSPDQKTNARLIARATGIVPWGPLPFIPGADDARLARAVARACGAILAHL